MRLHPLTALRDAARRGLLVGSVAFFVAATGSSFTDSFGIGLAVVLVPVGVSIGVAYGVAHYLRFSYELTDETLSIRSGVFARTDRAIPLHRVQNVDLRQSLFQRLLGLAIVRVETAGGGQTEAVLDFVSKVEAARLQREIRERKQTDAVVDDPDRSARPLFAIGDVELGLYALTSFQPASVLVLLFAVPFAWETASSIVLLFAAPLGGPTELDVSAVASTAGLVFALVGLALAAITSWAVSFLFTLVGYHGFVLARAGGDLVYERGLLRRYSGSIPLEKVQTLTVTEHVLARRLGYAGLSVETAGYSGGGDGGGGSDRLASAVPLARRERVLALAQSIEPFDELEFDRPPTRAKRRYAIRYLSVPVLLTAVLFGVGTLVVPIEYWFAPLVLVPLAPVAAQLKWANRGYHVGPDHVALRDGFWYRQTRIVPYYRLQTIETRRTLFQRRLGLASVVADTASSGSLLGTGAVAYDLRTDTGRWLHRILRDRLVELRGT